MRFITRKQVLNLNSDDPNSKLFKEYLLSKLKTNRSRLYLTMRNLVELDNESQGKGCWFDRLVYLLEVQNYSCSPVRCRTEDCRKLFLERIESDEHKN